MKTLLFIALCWMICSGCAKDVNNANTLSGNTTLSNTAKVSESAPIRELASVYHIDDLGWVLKTGEATYQLPDNLPQDFMKGGLQVLVVYTLRDKQTAEAPANGLTYIHIVSIKVQTATD